MPTRPREPDWGALLRSWDRQQEKFNPAREPRFDALLDVLEVTQPTAMQVLDLGCGPGSLTARLLRRFPKAHSTAVDFDPVILRVGQGALRRLRPRITWVEADIGSDGWAAQLPRRRFDAAISTTALHWLNPQQLRRLHREVRRLLRRGGVFLNGDFLPWGGREAGLSQIADAVRFAKFGKPGAQWWVGWNRWWKDLGREPTIKPLLKEREARFAHGRHSKRQLSVDFHIRSLRAAGFREVAVVWQELENRVMIAR
jgi:SAM-dependent methyltransferase